MKTLLSVLGFFAYSLAYVHTLSNILYPGLKDDLLEQPIQFMSQMKPTDEKDDLLVQPVQFLSSKKTPHSKITENESGNPEDKGSYVPYDFNKFDEYLHSARAAADRLDAEHNRVKRRAKRRRNGRRRRVSTTDAPHDDTEQSSSRNGTAAPDARRAAHSEFYHDRRGNKKKNKLPDRFNTYESANKQYESTYVEMPKDLYQAHLRPGVIFRIHMAEAILKMQYRNYGEDKDESVIEADVEYLRLTRKVISDEITKFEDLKWLTEWFTNRSELVQEHACNTRYYAVGIPPTLFTHPEEYMKRMCLFDNVYIDHIPYVVGEDNSLMAAVAPPVLHCDAATCTSVPFIDSIMFEERLPKTNVRTLTRCQASCRAHCRNDPDCLKRCSDRCMRAE